MRSVLIVVFDGLQISQVSPGLMPNLTAFSSDGVVFGNHHSVFPTVTRANVASILTGRYTGGHGLTGNSFVARDFDDSEVISATEPELRRLLDHTGNVLMVSGLSDILSTHGKEYIAVGIGSTGNAFLHNPNSGNVHSATIHPDFCLPRILRKELFHRFGEWPENTIPNVGRMAHAVRVMTEYVLAERSPSVSLLWFSEPDGSQHFGGVDSGLSLSALQEVDRQFGNLLEWLDSASRLPETDVIVLSDHGYSTVIDIVEIEFLIRSAGFPHGAEEGGVSVADNGGSCLFYAHKGDLNTLDMLTAWLMSQPWCGPIVASESVNGISGVLPASLAGMEGPRVPDLAMSFSWDSEFNSSGAAGRAYNTLSSCAVGTHGSMSRHEIRSVMVARGPSFKSGIRIQTPSSQVDIVPTILDILGFDDKLEVDGRVLKEALRGGPAFRSMEWSTQAHEATRTTGSVIYRQQISISEIDGSRYLDEGHSRLET